MDTETLQKRVIDIVADALKVPAARVNLQSSPDTLEEWDSLQHTLLVMTLEEEFGLQFNPEEVLELLKVELIVSLIEEKQTA
ncbi:acyl carrier protein [bacterium]|nr:acyl carrier protein [bacterium]